MRPFNTAGSLIPHFFPSFSRLFSFFFYCTQHAHTFPVLLVTVHGVAICAATATRRGPWRGPEFGVLFFFKYKNTEAVGTKNIYSARSFYFRLSLCPFPLPSPRFCCVCRCSYFASFSHLWTISDLDLGNTGREFSKRFDFSKLATERNGGAASSLEDADANVAREVAGSTLRATTHPWPPTAATAAAAALAGLIVVTVVVAVRAVVSDPMLDVGDSASAPPTPPKVANPAAAAAAAAATSAAGAAAVASGAPASIETLYGTLKSVRRGDHEDAENAIYCALLGGWTRLVNESGTQGRGWRCEMMR